MVSKLDTSLEEIECVFLDLDGTIYLGGELIPGAIDFLNRLKMKNIRFFFLSNNSSKSVNQYLAKLNAMNVHYMLNGKKQKNPLIRLRFHWLSRIIVTR